MPLVQMVTIQYCFNLILYFPDNNTMVNNYTCLFKASLWDSDALKTFRNDFYARREAESIQDTMNAPPRS